jgi:hypothetical protein
MPTKRTPINRDRNPPVTERAVRIFMRMQRCPREGDRWWQLHSELADEVQAKPWAWPAIEDPRHKIPEPDEEAQALWKVLDAAARDLRTRERQARRSPQ